MHCAAVTIILTHMYILQYKPYIVYIIQTQYNYLLSDTIIYSYTFNCNDYYTNVHHAITAVQYADFHITELGATIIIQSPCHLYYCKTSLTYLVSIKICYFTRP